jgi:nucleoid-associated protein YgaU
MSRENKLALIIGFGLVLFVAVLLSDHLSSQQRQITNDLHAATASLQQPLPEASVLVEFEPGPPPPETLPPAAVITPVLAEAAPEIPAPVVSVAEPSMPAAAPTPRPNEVAQGTYTVQPGDTLSEIAQKLLGTSKATASLYEMNRSVLPNMDALQVGMQLHYPLPPG